MSVRVGVTSQRAHRNGHNLEISGVVRDKGAWVPLGFTPRNVAGNTHSHVVSSRWIDGYGATSLLILSSYPSQSANMCGCPFHIPFFVFPFSFGSFSPLSSFLSPSFLFCSSAHMRFIYRAFSDVGGTWRVDSTALETPVSGDCRCSARRTLHESCRVAPILGRASNPRGAEWPRVVQGSSLRCHVARQRLPRMHNTASWPPMTTVAKWKERWGSGIGNYGIFATQVSSLLDVDPTPSTRARRASMPQPTSSSSSPELWYRSIAEGQPVKTH